MPHLFKVVLLSFLLVFAFKNFFINPSCKLEMKIYLFIKFTQISFAGLFL